MPKSREKKRKLLTAAYQAAIDINKLWGGPIGVRLACAYYADQPWASVASLADGHHLSEDTVRRRLEDLANIGRVDTKMEGRVKLYRASAKAAEKTYSIINQLALNAICDERFP